MVAGKSWGAADTPNRPRIYLHIGAMKTGTTYIQHLMAANRDALAAAGYLFPGRTWADQSRAARDALSRKPRAPDERSPWRAMAADMVAHPGEAAVFSMEFLSFADPDRAARIVESLEGAEVHAVLTVRDTTTVLPAQWQTSCRNGGTIPWPRFVNGVRHALRSEEGPPKSRSARVFQRTQGVVRMLGVWGSAVGAERLHVVTVPPRGSDPRLLWTRFAEVIGLDPAVCPNPPSSSNASMGHASTEMLRRLNLELKGLAQRDYERVVRGPLRPVLGARAQDEEPIGLNLRGAQLAARWNRRVLEAIADSGAQFVGSASDLPVGPVDASWPQELPSPDPEDILAAAIAARDGLIKQKADLEGQVDARATLEEAPAPDLGPIEEAAALVRDCVALTHLASGVHPVS